VWDALRDIGAVHRRLLPGRVLDTDVDGDVRTLVMPDGHVVRELIVAVDDEARRLAYAVIDGSRPALRHHHASLQVLAEGDGHSRLVWVTDVLPSSLAGEIRARTMRGAEEMKNALERAHSGDVATPRYPGNGPISR
jgi:Polyketide cyclase / dehydrase and lipid transport